MISKTVAGILAVAFGALLVAYMAVQKPMPSAAAWQAACEGGALGLEARNQAMEDGYTIHPQYHCIDKQSFEAVQAQQRAWLAGQAQRVAADEARKAAAAQAASQTLAAARQGFATQIGHVPDHPDPLPAPPPKAFVRVDCTNGSGLSLPAFVTPDPKDGQKHPAIVWLTGGDTNSLGDFWTPGPAANDQTASAFRRAGVVMMFPVLRGGNSAGGHRQFFHGEIDDVLAAADTLARLPHVDPEHIYLGGHSTGGTLALLTSAVSGRFRAVFALGPAARVTDYGTDLVPVSWATLPPEEARLRSPIHWLHGIARPTYLMEGVDRGSAASLSALCTASRNPQVRCFPVKGLDHFSMVDAAARLIAARIVQSHMVNTEFDLPADAFERSR